MATSQVSRHKYGAKPTVVDNIRFASKAEAKRYGELKMLEKAGEITHLILQPRFSLWVSCPLVKGAHGERDSECVGEYVADFQYRDQRGVTVTEDVKGMKTPLYRLKKKIVEACYDITITEITR